MAEERIVIEKHIACDFGECGAFYTEGVGEYFCDWNGNHKRITEKDCKNCVGISRQEAIERMAKARYTQSPCYDARGDKVSFEDFREDYEPCYEDLVKEVEPLLNALLED